MVNAVAPEPQKSLESAQLTPAEAKRIKRIEDLVEPWKQKLTDHHIYDLIKTADDLKVFMAGHI
jgi:hypothetical protein